MEYIEWFKNNFPKESENVNFLEPLRNKQKLRLSHALLNLIMKHPRLIQTFAKFYKELVNIDFNFDSYYDRAISNLVQDQIIRENKIKENEIRFWSGLFECEQCALGISSSVTDYVNSISFYLQDRNEANDVMFLLAIKRLYHLLKRENPALLDACLNYVRKLKYNIKLESIGDLNYNEQLLDPEFKKSIDKLGRSKRKRMVLTYSLTYNTLDLAKYFLQNVLENPTHLDEYNVH